MAFYAHSVQRCAFLVWFLIILFLFILFLLAVITMRIKVKVSLCATNVVMQVSFSTLYFIELNDIFVLNFIDSKLRMFLFNKPFRLKKKKRKKKIPLKTTLGMLRAIKVKKLRIFGAVGLEQADHCALLCGTLLSVFSSIAVLLCKSPVVDIRPAFGKNQFKLKIDCIIGLSLANIINMAKR